MKKVGLYFGSFNPVHIGHLIIANFMVSRMDLDEVWFVVSPQSPFKKKDVLVDQDHRLKMVNLATLDNMKFKVSDLEFDMPKPNYTIDTLQKFRQNHPDFEFSVIMGEDNLLDLHKWKGFEEIIRDYKILVYPRNLKNHNANRLNMEDLPEEVRSGDIEICDAPLLMISSTFVRNSIYDQQDVRYLLPEPVIRYISNNFFYEQ